MYPPKVALHRQITHNYHINSSTKVPEGVQTKNTRMAPLSTYNKPTRLTLLNRLKPRPAKHSLSPIVCRKFYFHPLTSRMITYLLPEIGFETTTSVLRENYATKELFINH